MKLNIDHVFFHYSRFFGEPENMVLLENDELPHVVEFAPLIPTRGWVYATAGISLLPVPNPPDWTESESELGFELFIRSTQQNPELFSTLLDLARYAIEQKSALDFGQLIKRPNGKSVTESSSMADFVLLPPFAEPEKFAAFRVDNQYVRLFWVIPLHKSEAAFLQKNGVQALVELFYSEHPNTSDLMRAPII